MKYLIFPLFLVVSCGDKLPELTERGEQVASPHLPPELATPLEVAPTDDPAPADTPAETTAGDKPEVTPDPQAAESTSP